MFSNREGDEEQWYDEELDVVKLSIDSRRLSCLWKVRRVWQLYRAF